MLSLLLFERRHLYRYSNAFILSKHFYWNYINSLHNYQHAKVWFIECPVGYYGVDCSVPCPLPTYGRFCAEHCSCSSASCHHVYGCNETAGWENISFFYENSYKSFRWIMNCELNVLCFSNTWMYVNHFREKKPPLHSSVSPPPPVQSLPKMITKRCWVFSVHKELKINARMMVSCTDHQMSIMNTQFTN